MKKLFYIAVLLVFPVMIYSQPNSLVSDQNPRYQESQDRYMKLRDSLTAWHNTTIQNTYKAYDWREAREERRKQRREWRHQERLLNSYYSGYDYYGYYPYAGYSYSPSYYYPSYGYGSRWGSTGLHVGLGYIW